MIHRLNTIEDYKNIYYEYENRIKDLSELVKNNKLSDMKILYRLLINDFTENYKYYKVLKNQNEIYHKYFSSIIEDVYIQSCTARANGKAESIIGSINNMSFYMNYHKNNQGIFK